MDISSDEETFQQTATEQKVKRTHQEKKLYKQQQQEATKTTLINAATAITESLPERPKENAKVVRHNNKTQDKPLGDGHYHDRRSGTGRV